MLPHRLANLGLWISLISVRCSAKDDSATALPRVNLVCFRQRLFLMNRRFSTDYDVRVDFLALREQRVDCQAAQEASSDLSSLFSQKNNRFLVASSTTSDSGR